MNLKLPNWATLLDAEDTNHGLLLPILLYCVDDHGRPLLGTRDKHAAAKASLRTAHKDIPAVVEAIRQYWMPIRYKTAV